jgi:hypothetical protein
MQHHQQERLTAVEPEKMATEVLYRRPGNRQGEITGIRLHLITAGQVSRGCGRI